MTHYNIDIQDLQDSSCIATCRADTLDDQSQKPDEASPSPRDEDLAFSALLWVPLTAPDADEQSGSDDASGLSRRLDLLLDAYRYDSDRRAFGAVIAERGRRQAVRVVRRGAAGRLLDAVA